MNRTSFSKKNSNRQRPQVDRFVTQRERLHELSRKIRWVTPDTSTDDIWSSKYLRQKRYANYLNSAMDLEPISDRKECVQLWPCTPRKKSYLLSAESILDLPRYSEATFPELLDWSSDNILVAALGTHYYRWSWQSQSQISQGVTAFGIQCCKFDPTGKLLALGTHVQTVEVHDTELGKAVARGFCDCLYLRKPRHFCSITALDWSPTGKSFIVGCSNGTLMSFNRDAKKMRGRTVSSGAILITRISPDARYATAASDNGNAVLIFNWPNLMPICTLEAEWTIKALTWHPWCSALLGIGCITPDFNSRVSVWDAPRCKMRKRSLCRKNYCLDAMLFSKRTGELVLSLWNMDAELSLPHTGSQLVVMSDPDTVVDQWGEGESALDRVRTMVFSPDGSKFATATADEDLMIWNFLPEDKCKIKKYCKRFCAMPSYLDIAELGFTLR